MELQITCNKPKIRHKIVMLSEPFNYRHPVISVIISNKRMSLSFTDKFKFPVSSGSNKPFNYKICHFENGANVEHTVFVYGDVMSNKCSNI